MPSPAEMPTHSHEELNSESLPESPEQLAIEDLTVPDISPEAKLRNLHDRLQANEHDEHALAELSKLPDDQWDEYNRYASSRALLESGASAESAKELAGHPVTDEEILAKWHEAGVDEHEEVKATPILEEMYYNPDSPKVRARLESMTLSPEEAAAVGPEKAAQLAAQKAKFEDDFETYRAQRQARVHLGDIRDVGEAQEHLIKVMDEHAAEGGVAASETFEALKNVKAKLPTEAYRRIEAAYLGDLVAAKGSTSFEVTRAMHELDLPQEQYAKIMEARSVIDRATPEEIKSLTPEEIKELTADDPDALKLLETRKAELAEAESKAKADAEAKAETPPEDESKEDSGTPKRQLDDYSLSELFEMDRDDPAAFRALTSGLDTDARRKLRIDIGNNQRIQTGRPPVLFRSMPLTPPVPAPAGVSGLRDPAEAPLPTWLSSRPDERSASAPERSGSRERSGARNRALKVGAAAVFAAGSIAGGAAVSSLTNSTVTMNPTASNSEASRVEMGGGGTADETPEDKGRRIELQPVEQSVRLGTWNPDRSQGAIWYIAKNNLRERGVLRPTDRQVYNRTQQILDHNKLTWEQAKDLGSKYRVRIPPLA